jgi:hypothetical protein
MEAVLYWGRAAFCEKEGEKCETELFREFVLPPYIFPHKHFIRPTPQQNSECFLKAGEIISGNIKAFGDPDYNIGGFFDKATARPS